MALVHLFQPSVCPSLKGRNLAHRDGFLTDGTLAYNTGATGLVVGHDFLHFSRIFALSLQFFFPLGGNPARKRALFLMALQLLP
jgi:uncharacterized membrane protein